MFEGAILNPHTVAAAFHGGLVGAIFYPLSRTASHATPPCYRAVGGHRLPGPPVQHRRGRPVGGRRDRRYLPRLRLSLPPVVHVIVCLLGGFAGGAVIGWIVGELKARTGAHEVIVTIMLNYIMYNFLSFLLGTPKALQQPGQSNLISPPVAASARLPHVGGPPPQVDAGFLIALAAAAGRVVAAVAVHDRVPVPHGGCQPERGPQLRDERRGELGPRDADRRRPGGLAGAAVILGPVQSITFNSYGTYGFDGITVALLGRASPVGVVLAALLFGALHAGGTAMEAATQVPSSLVQVLQGLIVLFVAAPPLVRAMFRLREARAAGLEAVPKGWNT